MIKVLLVISALFGVAAATLGFMAKDKVENLQGDLKNTKEQLVRTQDDLAKTKETLAQTEATLSATRTELETKKQEAVRLSSELATAKATVEDLTTKLADESKKAEDYKLKLDQLQTYVDGFTKKGPDGGGGDLQTQIENMQKDLEAERAEKKLLEDQLTTVKEQADALKLAEQHRKDKVMARGLTGRVLAVNPAWNFVVLNLGDRQGVVEGGDMIIRRGNVMVGKIKITSVEPSTSIGDIIMSSVPRGMQVQPGDMVVYPGQ